MAIDFERALSNFDKNTRLNAKASGAIDRAMGSGQYVDDIAAQINAGVLDRANRRTINRTIGAGPWQGRTPFTSQFNPAMVNPTGATTEAIAAQARGPLAIGPGSGGGVLQPATSRAAAVPLGPGVGSGQAALPSAGLSAGPSINAGQATYAKGAQGAAGVADDALAIGRGTQGASATGRAAAAAGSVMDDAAAVLGSTADDIAMQAANPAARAGLLANVSKATLIRGAGVAGAGYMASGIIDSFNVGGENSDWDRILSGASFGAGLGAGGMIAATGLGLATGPVGWAALGGAALFGGAKYLWGDDETSLEKMQGTVDDTRNSILEVGQMYGLDANSLDDILMQYDLSASLYLENEDKEGMKAWMAGLTQTLPAMMLQQKQEADRYGQMIALQGQFAPMFEAQMGRAAQASEVAMQSANDVAGYFEEDHPNLAALTRQVAAQSNESSQRLMAAYAQQIAMSPAMNEQSYQQQMALQQATAYPVG